MGNSRRPNAGGTHSVRERSKKPKWVDMPPHVGTPHFSYGNCWDEPDTKALAHSPRSATPPAADPKAKKRKTKQPEPLLVGYYVRLVTAHAPSSPQTPTTPPPPPLTPLACCLSPAHATAGRASHAGILNNLPLHKQSRGWPVPHLQGRK